MSNLPAEQSLPAWRFVVVAAIVIPGSIIAYTLHEHGYDSLSSAWSFFCGVIVGQVLSP